MREIDAGDRSAEIKVRTLKQKKSHAWLEPKGLFSYATGGCASEGDPDLISTVISAVIFLQHHWVLGAPCGVRFCAPSPLATSAL